MGKKICLTEEQREADKVNRLNRKIADGLAAYKNRHGLTQIEMADILGVGRGSVVKLLSGDGVVAGTTTWMKIIRAAGLRIVEVKEELPQ